MPARRPFILRSDAGKRTVIIGAQGAPDTEAFTSVYEEVSRVLQMFGMDVQETFMDIGHHAPGEVRVNTELMEKAKMAGSQLLK